MRFVMALICTVISTFVVADERFYTTVDAQGRVQVIKSEPPTAVERPKLPVSSMESVVSEAEPKQEINGSSLKQGTRQLDADTYVDTELLERKNFNVEDKKRFYFLPNTGFGTQVVESKDGVVNAPIVSQELVKPTAYVSSNYLPLSVEDVQRWYPQLKQCMSQSDIKKHSKPLKDSHNVWVKPPLIPDIFEFDELLALSSATPVIKQLRVVSFANSDKKPAFYLPIMVFLGETGCPVAGVWQYWSRAHIATDKQYASVEGLINIPAHSAYVLFYRPIKTLKADIPLSVDSGSLVVEAY
ncbi:MAG: hypothetical protein RJA86_938 [Pseudomonadota bacterium]